MLPLFIAVAAVAAGAAFIKNKNNDECGHGDNTSERKAQQARQREQKKKRKRIQSEINEYKQAEIKKIKQRYGITLRFKDNNTVYATLRSTALAKEITALGKEVKEIKRLVRKFENEQKKLTA